MEITPFILLACGLIIVAWLAISALHHADEAKDGLHDLRQSVKEATDRIWRAIEEIERRDG